MFVEVGTTDFLDTVGREFEKVIGSVITGYVKKRTLGMAGRGSGLLSRWNN